MPQNDSLVHSLPAEMKILLMLAKKTLEKPKLNLSCSALFHMKSRVSLKYLVNDCRSAIRSANHYTMFTQPWLVLGLALRFQLV